ncbi:hypothetical protein MRX96_008281 [Rhipicephalus microplus]
MSRRRTEIFFSESLHFTLQKAASNRATTTGQTRTMQQERQRRNRPIEAPASANREGNRHPSESEVADADKRGNPSRDARGAKRGEMTA